MAPRSHLPILPFIYFLLNLFSNKDLELQDKEDVDAYATFAKNQLDF